MWLELKTNGIKLIEVNINLSWRYIRKHKSGFTKKYVETKN